MRTTLKVNRWIVAAAVVAACVRGQQSIADETADTIKALKQQIEELDQKVRVLSRKAELDPDSSTEASKQTPVIVAGAEGFGIRSADTNFVFKLRGVLQLDSRTFFDDHGIVGNDGFLLRRVRPIFEGTLYRDFDFVFTPDFAGSTVQIFDAYMNYRNRPELQLRIGKFKTPVGLEQLQLDRDILFNERALPTDLVPNRDVGAMLHGNVFGGGLSYAAAIFNGVGDSRNSNNADFEDDKEFAGRLFLRPFKHLSTASLRGFGFGVGGSFGQQQKTNTFALPNTTGGTLPGYTTDGQQQFFAYNPVGANVVSSGDHWRVSPQASYYWGPLGMMGEYAISNQKVNRVAGGVITASSHLDHTAWQIAGSWLLTGENASFDSVVPRRSFNPGNGGWGALQVVARYAQLDIDDAAFPLFSDPATSASKASAWAVGLNWYLNRNIRLETSYSHTTFAGGGGPGTTVPAIITRQPESVLFTRVQLAF